MWVSELENKIFTIIKHKVTKKFGTKYKSMRVTNSSKIPDVPKFPTVYFEPLDSVEVGSDLDNVGINGVNYSYQLSVTALEESQAKEIIDYCVDISKEMRFMITTMPIKQDTGDIFCRVIRCRRIVGSNDVI